MPNTSKDKAKSIFFHCVYCTKQYLNKRELSRHVRTKHSEIKAKIEDAIEETERLTQTLFPIETAKIGGLNHSPLQTIEAHPYSKPARTATEQAREHVGQALTALADRALYLEVEINKRKDMEAEFAENERQREVLDETMKALYPQSIKLPTHPVDQQFVDEFNKSERYAPYREPTYTEEELHELNLKGKSR